MGFAFYKGVLRINLATFFKWTGAILIVVAAGVLAYGVHDLQEAGILPGLNNLAFDVSEQIPPSCWHGTILKGTLNFSPATTWLEASPGCAYLVPTMTAVPLPDAHPAQTAPPSPGSPAGPHLLSERLHQREPNAHRRLPVRPDGDDLRVQRDRVQGPFLERGRARSRWSPPPTRVSSPASKAPSGNVAFKVKNTGQEVTEFYLYAEDGLRIIGEIENVGPGLSRDLVVRAAPGTYVTSCRPGMTGKGIRSEFTVTDSGEDTKITGVDQATIDAATSQYAAYVKDQASQLVDQTEQFNEAYKSGNDDEAARCSRTPATTGSGSRRSPSRSATSTRRWTCARPTSRRARTGPAGTGSRRTSGRRPPATQQLTQAERAKYADDLMANTKILDQRVQTLEHTVDQIGNGSKGLLDEVASNKITGEEDIWSHTDLYDFQANVDGARVGYEGLKPLLEVKDPELSKQIESAFDALQLPLDKYKVGEADFVFYDKVTEAQRKELSDAVNTLAEPLSKMTGAITL